jgi:enamine deaminase RidA (YjgF/YER057c/UK114 family)
MPDIVRKDTTPRLCRITGYGDLAFLFLSGDTPEGRDPDTPRQAGEVLDRLAGMLAEIGSSKAELLSATIWIAEIGWRDAVAAVWDRWLGEHPAPTLSIVEGGMITTGKLVEIGFVARRAFSSNSESTSMPAIERLVPNDKPRISRVVKYGDLIFLAGVTAPDPSPDFKTQMRQVFSRIDGFLAEAGSDKHHILSCTNWLSDVRNIGLMNEVWDEWVSKESPPARATVEARLASPGLYIEIGIVAAPAK